MKILWCWRCKMEVPMLNDKEFAIAPKLYGDAFGFKKGTLDERFQPLIEYYYSITGSKDFTPNAIMHHQISQYESRLRILQ